MNHPLETPNPNRMWGSDARTIAIDQHCHYCLRCLAVEGAWIACDHNRCDEAIPPKDVLHWETARATVKRIGRSPLQLCQYVGTC